MRGRGFTLIELAIVILIIGLLFGGVLKGQSLFQAAKVSNALALAQDLSAAVNAFKQQYRLLPGDMSITSITPEVPNVRTECKSGGSNAGDNNGLIDAGASGTKDESRCVSEVLSKAGLAKADQEGGWAVFKSYYGPVTVKAARLSPGVTAAIAASYPFPATHVVEFANLPCAVAQEMDRKIDNDNLVSGKGVAGNFVPDPNNPLTCAADSFVPFYAVAL